MDAVKYLKEKARMVKVSSNGSCRINCEDCGLSYYKNGRKISCGCFEKTYPEEAVSIVEKWSEEHKLKTRAQIFFERFPDAPKHRDGRPKPCALDCGLANECPNEYCAGTLQYCVYCWDEPVSDK